MRIPIHLPEVEALADQVHLIAIALDGINAKLTNLEAMMSALSDAVAAAAARVNDDFAHLRDLLDQALATETANQAEIARLTSEADAVQADVNQAVADLANMDPDPDNPVVVEEPPVEEPPVENPPV